MNIFDLLSQAIIPIVILILGIFYKNVIVDIINNYKNISIKLPASMGEIKLDSKQAGKKLTELFTEFDAVYNHLLKDYNKLFFKELVEKDKNKESQPTVKEMIPEFNRKDPEWEKTKEGKEKLGMLRALRGLGLIAPVGTRSWQEDSKIEITKFGKTLTEHKENKT